MTADARLQKLYQDYVQALHATCELPLSDPRFERWNTRTLVLDRTIRETMPDSLFGLSVRWAHFRRQTDVAFGHETGLMAAINAFEEALLHLRLAAERGGGAP